MKKPIKMLSALCSFMILLTGCSGSDSSAADLSSGSDAKFTPGDIKLTESAAVKSENADPIDYKQSKVLFKAKYGYNNPISTNIFCADPTSIECDGRLYVYGTNDSQQYELKPQENTYEKIQSLVIFSTDDMVNWRYEGLIDTKSIAPWITASWAPSIVARQEDDGLTHYYLYFSNSGGGVGVITATSPTGPWNDPLGKPLIRNGMPGLTDCPQPFDPGVCIDDDGVGWLAFGGGVAKNGTDQFPGTSRIVKLGADMISLDSEIKEIKAPYFFEASELNFINGTYVYTYNTSWEKRTEWDLENAEKPNQCSMCYMTSKTPLDTDSWEYHGTYLKNPGDLKMEYGNNHTHLHKYNDQWYILFHSQSLQKRLSINGGFRSLCAYPAEVDESTPAYKNIEASVDGCEQLKPFDPYKRVEAEECFLTDCTYTEEAELTAMHCDGQAIFAVKGVDFGEACSALAAKVKGTGTIEVRLDEFDSPAVMSLGFDCSDWSSVYNDCGINGQHDVFFILSGTFDIDAWQAYK